MATDPTTQSRLVLVVDDDPHTRNLLRDLCEASGYRVVQAEDGVECLEKLPKENPDMVLLDLMMPRKDGFAVLKSMRDDARYKDIPVIVLTAMGDMDGKIRGMELGADDYVTKPFNPREVLARVRALLRRQQRTQEMAPVQAIQIGALRLDPARYEVTLDGAPLEMTRTEFNLLHALMKNPGYVFTRSELIESALGYTYESIERTLDSHIKNLRRKIGDNPKEPVYIHTVYGVGYRMADDL